MDIEQIIYPKHKHPHGVGDTTANENRIWVCEECRRVFTDEEARKDIGQWGHICKKVTRCESHLEPYLPELLPPHWQDKPDRPKVVCLCGSTRFGEAFRQAQLKKTLDGEIVLTIGCNMKTDTELFSHLSETELVEIKRKLDELHKRKIDMCDYILVLNVDGYIGDSTRSEIEYAKAHNKPITYLETPTLEAGR